MPLPPPSFWTRALNHLSRHGVLGSGEACGSFSE